jgi:copper transport protein
MPIAHRISIYAFALLRGLLPLLLALLVLGLVAGWRFTPPPRALAHQIAAPVWLHLHSAELMAELQLNPGSVGPVAVTIALADGNFGPVQPLAVTLTISSAELGVGPLSRQAQPDPDGTWRIDEPMLPFAGTWEVVLEAQLDRFSLARLGGTISIR